MQTTYQKNKKEISFAHDAEGNRKVIRRYADPEILDKTIDALSKMQHTGYSPRLIETGEGMIVTEYIDGVLFRDIFTKALQGDDPASLMQLADRLGIFFQIFYSVCGDYVFNDVDFTNFIVKNERCYGIDYENVGEGLNHMDIAGVLSYSIYYANGDMETVFPFIKRFLNNFHLDIIDIINEVKISLGRVAERKNQIFGIDEIADMLVKFNETKI